MPVHRRLGRQRVDLLRGIKVLRRLLRLKHADYAMLSKALVCVTAARLGLWLLPFRTLCALPEKIGAHGSKSSSSNKQLVAKVGWAIAAVSRFVPQATCLTQALAAQTLLKTLSQPARMRIGVAKGERGNLEAHAWVESGGRVIVGQSENLSRYALLASSDKNELL